MNSLKIKLAFTTLVLSSLFFSCKKEKTLETNCSINMQNLSGTYKLVAMQYKASPNTAEIDYLPFMDACEKDDDIILKPNGTYNYNDIGISCTPNESDNGVWALNGNLINSDGIMNGTIKSFDCKTLVFYLDDYNMQKDRITVTMAKK
jgi:hypothetical protein